MPLTTKSRSSLFVQSFKVTTTPPSSSVVSYPVTVTWSDMTSGAQNPKWRSQVRMHINATTPYACDRYKVVLSNGVGVYKQNLVPGLPIDIIVKSTGQLIQSITLPSLGSSGTCFNDAYFRFIRRANQELRALQGGQTLGEIRETIHLIRHPAEALKRGMMEYLSVVPTRARKAVRGSVRGSGRRRAVQNAISGTYLEYANGWRPLVEDIKDASRVLAEQFNPFGVAYRKIHVSAQEPTEGIAYPVFIGGDSYFNWYQQGVEKRDASCRIVGEVVVSCSGSASDLIRNSGFTLRDFVPTMWELLPLSYVADWFLNMGNVLEAYAFNSANVAWQCRTLRLKSSRTEVAQPVPPATGPGAPYEYSLNPGSVTVERTALSRGVIDDWTPSLAFSLPGTHLLSKLANVSSLYQQAGRSSRQLNRLLNG